MTQFLQICIKQTVFMFVINMQELKGGLLKFTVHDVVLRLTALWGYYRVFYLAT